MSKTISIAYCGSKDAEDAFSDRTGGIVWGPGSVHEIPEALALRMLEHPDVFCRDGEQPQPREPGSGKQVLIQEQQLQAAIELLTAAGFVVLTAEEAAQAEAAVQAQMAADTPSAPAEVATADADVVKATEVSGDVDPATISLAPGAVVAAAPAADPAKPAQRARRNQA